MKITATFSDALTGQLKGKAVGDEFTVTAKARIVAAEEVLVELTTYGDPDRVFTQGELEVRLLLSHGEVAA